MGGYAYAADNPVTGSDPAGLIPVSQPGNQGQCNPADTQLTQCGGSGGNPPPGGGASGGNAGCPSYQQGCPGYTQPGTSSGGQKGTANTSDGSSGTKAPPDICRIDLAACLQTPVQLNVQNPEQPGNEFEWPGSLPCADPLFGQLLDCPSLASGETGGNGGTGRITIRVSGADPDTLLQVLYGLLRLADADSSDLALVRSMARSGGDLTVEIPVSEAIDPDEEAENLTGDASHDTASKVFMANADEVGDAVNQLAITTQPPDVPPAIVDHAGDIVTSAGLIASWIATYVWKQLFG